MIEGIVQLKAELKPLGLREFPPFLQAHIPIDVMRRTEIGQESWCVSKCEWVGLRKCRRVNPIVERLILRHRTHTRHDIGALVEIPETAVGVVFYRVDG